MEQKFHILVLSKHTKRNYFQQFPDTPGSRKNKFGMNNNASCLKEDEEEDVDEDVDEDEDE